MKYWGKIDIIIFSEYPSDQLFKKFQKKKSIEQIPRNVDHRHNILQKQRKLAKYEFFVKDGNYHFSTYPGSLIPKIF